MVDYYGICWQHKKMHSLLSLHHFMLIPTSKDVKTRITTDGGNLDQWRNWAFIIRNYNRKQNWRYVWRHLISRNKDITTQWCIFKKRHLLNVIKYSLYMNTFELYYKSPGSIFKSQTHVPNKTHTAGGRSFLHPVWTLKCSFSCSSSHHIPLWFLKVLYFLR